MSWVLLAGTGALTAPHHDALGLGTWSQSYRGELGFAWLMMLNVNVMEVRRAATDGFQGGR